jgi:hypothetical protein
MSRRTALVETALVFLVFFLHGAAPVPEVNEPNYLGKAIHHWNPAWAPNDFFLDSADAHQLFYFTFGWLSLWLSPVALAWVGRLLTWALLAGAWRRLSFAVVPKAWLAPLTAAVFVALLQRFNLAGEWVIGGVEAKGFAFVLVFLGLEAWLQDRWNRAWLLFGAASAFHVLVGGWTVLAVGLVWLAGRVLRRGPSSGPSLPSLVSMLPGLLGGLLLALPGLVPSLLLNWHTDRQTVQQANVIYVYERLPHHLDPWRFPPTYVVAFAVLVAVWLVLCRIAPPQPPVRRLRAFVAAALAISLTGLLVSLLDLWDRALAAGLLRFYWFRLADVAVPLGVTLMGAAWITAPCGAAVPAASSPAGSASRRRRWWLAAVLVLAGFHLADCVVVRLFSGQAQGERLPNPVAWKAALAWLAHPGQTPVCLQPPADRLTDYAAWRAACQWVATSGEIPPDARFLTPRMSQTFKWYAHRGEVVSWKEVPQDAQGIVEWYRRSRDIHEQNPAPWHEEPGIVRWWQGMHDRIFGTDEELPERWYESLADLGPERLRKLGAEYHADYAIMIEPEETSLPLPVVHRDGPYVIYWLGP